MAIVEAGISISVDGFIAGPNTDQYPGLGQGGEILHVWLGGDRHALRAPPQVLRP